MAEAAGGGDEALDPEQRDKVGRLGQLRAEIARLEGQQALLAARVPGTLAW